MSKKALKDGVLSGLQPRAALSGAASTSSLIKSPETTIAGVLHSGVSILPCSYAPPANHRGLGLLESSYRSRRPVCRR
jgi:hypothetical protein